MSVTEQGIKNLTPQHRIMWKHPAAPREVEMGLWEDEFGDLRTDMGDVVRWADEGASVDALASIVRIIEPAFQPRRGLVIRHPEDEWDLLVCFGPDKWLTRDGAGWLTDDDARFLIEKHGWKVVDDLAKEKDDD